MKKTVILPILSSLALVLGTLTGHKFNDSAIDLTATIAAVVITAGVNVYGIIQNHKKEVK